MGAAEVFLAVHEVHENETIEVPVDTAICLFILDYLNQPVDVNVSFVLVPKGEACSLLVQKEGFNFRLINKEQLQRPVSDCHMPVFTIDNGFSCVAGLCAVLRHIIKYSGKEWRKLLGFREGCLVACAEVSLWTKFCEVDMVKTVEELLEMRKIQTSITANTNINIPLDVARFEEHLKQSVRVHNYKKILHETNQEFLEHSFAESNQISLADLIILPCFHIILTMIGVPSVLENIPLISKWYDLVRKQDYVMDSLDIFKSIGNQCEPMNGEGVDCVLPAVPAQSLYKSDPKRYRPKSRLFTKQDEVESVLEIMDQIVLTMKYSLLPFGHEQPLNWQSLPSSVRPTVPEIRMDRKTQQLENLAKAVLKVAQPGDTIVDFCSGSGHLGILLAYCLPESNIVLLDNKEESLARAQARVIDMELKNIQIVQCNLDYYKGSFQIGMSLHACGVASDLVIQTCLQHRAAFVVCPCCYGSLQDNHKVNYPQSRCLRESALNKRDFFVLGHCADQTHKKLYKKSEQGERCMSIVDYDRCLQAKDNGYSVVIAKLVPSSCTPKNNLLVGIPQPS